MLIRKQIQIQNSDGQTIAGVVDIIGQEHMKPITNEMVFEGTQQVTEGMKRDEYGDPGRCSKSLRNKRQRIFYQILLMNNILQQPLRVLRMACSKDQVNHLVKWQHLVSKKRNQIHMVREQS